MSKSKVVDEGKAVYAERLKELLEYIESIPRKQFDLDCSETNTDKVCALKCKAVGCIAGWGCSMIPFKSWMYDRGLCLFSDPEDKDSAAWQLLEQYLGIADKFIDNPFFAADQDEQNELVHLFDGRNNKKSKDSGRAEAITRINLYIKAMKTGKGLKALGE